ncbi:hypothetical protein RJ640_000663, partial [Escallonia rubra]
MDTQGGELVAMDAGDWRNQLQADSRQRIVNKINQFVLIFNVFRMETLKGKISFSGGQEELQELKKIAVRFEEKTYTAATSQSDYLRKISLKMLTIETKSQNTLLDAGQSNGANNSKIPLDPGTSVKF